MLKYNTADVAWKYHQNKHRILFFVILQTKGEEEEAK
jgi:hypothetical protein